MLAKSLEPNFLLFLCNVLVLRPGVYREENKTSENCSGMVVINYKVVIDGGEKL